LPRFLGEIGMVSAGSKDESWSNNSGPSHLSSEEQKEKMREWFFAHYENPVERTPYESREGGYIYIWGGPYEAEEVLRDQFDGYVKEEVIQELLEELNEESYEWTKAESKEDYDDYFADIILSNTKFHASFLSNIGEIEALLRIRVSDKLKQKFLMLLHVSLITAIETYLSDAFINQVMNDKNLIRKFVEVIPEYKNEKISISELFNTVDKIRDKCKEYMLQVLWHNMAKVMPMYKSVLGIDFPKDRRTIYEAIDIRHDIVHRNGKTKEGKAITLEKKDITNLIQKTKEFVYLIDSQFENCEWEAEIEF